MALGSRLFRFVATTAAFAFCLFSVVSAQTTYTITDLGTLGGMFSSGKGINASGQVAGNSSPAGFGPAHAFLYSNGTMTDLGTLGGFLPFSLAAGINSSGQVTGVSSAGSIRDDFEHAFSYSGGVMTDLGTLAGVFSFSEGHGINDSGQVTGESNNADFATHAFVYSGGIMTDLGTLGGSVSQGLGINASGQITGASFTTDDISIHPFLYSGGAMTDLGTLGGGFGQGNGINGSGQVTGLANTTSEVTHAFLYSGGNMTDLGTLGGNFSQGLGINASGQVVGSSAVLDGNLHAFVYNPDTGMVDLNTLLPSGSGWTLSEATGINDAGQITGGGFNPNFLQHAFLLTPVTVPFSTFDARLGLTGKPPTKFRIRGSFTLGTGSTGIDPVNQSVTLKVGTLSVSIPQGSFTTTSKGDYDFQGTVGTVAILFRIKPVSSTSFTWEANGATNTGLPTANPVTVGLTIGNNTGTVSVTAHGQHK